MAYYSSGQLKGLMATTAPQNRKAVIQSMIARGDQLEGFNAKAPAVSAPAPSAPKEEPGFLSKVSNFGAQAVGGLAKGAGRTLSLAGKAADYVTPDISTIGKGVQFMGDVITPKAYEKYNPLSVAGKGIQSADKKVGDFFQSKLGTSSYNPISLLGAGAQKLGQTAQDVSTQISGVSKDALSSKVGRGLGEGTAMFLGGGAGAKAGQALGNAASKFLPSAVAKVPGFLGSSAGFTQGATAASEGRLATLKEMGTGLKWDAGFGLLGGVGRLLGQGSKALGGKAMGASLGLKKKTAEELFAQHGTKAEDIVREFKLFEGAEKNLAKIKPQLKETWRSMKAEASKIKPLNQSSYDTIEKGLIDKVVGQLDTLGKKKTAETLTEMVNDIRPLSGSRSGVQVLDDIKELNKVLYNYGERGVLSPKQINSAMSALKDEFKKFLPESVVNNYVKYAKLSTAQKAFSDSVTRKAVGRTVAGASAGGVAGAASSIARGAGVADVALGGGMGALAAGAAARLTASPSVLARTGQILDAAPDVLGKLGSAGITAGKLAQRAVTSGGSLGMDSAPTQMTPEQVPETSAFKSIINESVQPITDAPEFSSQFPPAIANSPLLSKIASGEVTLTKAQKEELLGVMPEASVLIDQAEELAKKAPGKGKAIPASKVETIAKSRSMERQFKDLAIVLAKVESKMGPLGKGKFATWNPYDPDVRELMAMIQSLTGQTAKNVMQEVGALTESDLANVAKVLPQMSDTPESAANKLAYLINNVKLNRETLIDEYEANGYNVEAMKNNQRVKFKEGQGKALPANAIEEMAKFKNLGRQMGGLKSSLDRLSSKLGPAAGNISTLDPYDTDVRGLIAEIQSLVNPTARGVMMEVGALTLSDLERVDKVLPQMTDTPEVALRKINNLIKNLEENQQDKILAYSQAGYNVGGSGSEANPEDVMMTPT